MEFRFTKLTRHYSESLGRNLKASEEPKPGTPSCKQRMQNFWTLEPSEALPSLILTQPYSRKSVPFFPHCGQKSDLFMVD